MKVVDDLDEAITNQDNNVHDLLCLCFKCHKMRSSSMQTVILDENIRKINEGIDIRDPNS